MLNIADIWKGIERWLNQEADPFYREMLRPGCDEKELDEAERKLGYSIPKPLRESLLKHDGEKRGLFFHWSLLSLSEIVKYGIQDGKLRFFEENEDSYMVLDLTQEPQPVLWISYKESPELIAADFVSFFSSLAEGIERGEMGEFFGK